MKILYVNDALAIWGGLERILVEKVNELSSRYCFEVYVLTVSQGHHPMPFLLCSEVIHRDLNIQFHRQYQARGLRRFWLRYKLNRTFRRRLKEQICDIYPDVIVSMRWGLVRPLVRLRSNIPIVYEAHTLCFESSYQHLNMIKRCLYKRDIHSIKSVQTVVSLTEGDAMEWKRINSNVIVIPNVVNLNTSGCYSDCQSKSVIYVGRYDEQKDMSSLLSIWEIVHHKHPDWQLHIYGGYGDEKNKILARISQLNINLCVHEPIANIIDKYIESSIFVLTSIYEPFGLVLPEAMSCGLPVVAFDCPYGPADIITDGKDGFLIKNRDLTEFANKVCLLIDNLELRKAMGQAGIQSSQRYGASLIMPKWKDLFEQLISNKNDYL